MTEDYKFEISSQDGEAWRDPETLYRDTGNVEHHLAVALMNELANVAEPCEGVSVDRVKRESTLEPTIDRHVGPKLGPSTQMDGGVPFTTYFEMLTIAGATYGAFIGFLKAASPIIVQHMKNKNAPTIVVQKGNKKIEVHSKEDLEHAIRAMKKIK